MFPCGYESGLLGILRIFVNVYGECFGKKGNKLLSGRMEWKLSEWAGHERDKYVKEKKQPEKVKIPFAPGTEPQFSAPSSFRSMF